MLFIKPNYMEVMRQINKPDENQFYFSSGSFSFSRCKTTFTKCQFKFIFDIYIKVC